MPVSNQLAGGKSGYLTLEGYRDYILTVFGECFCLDARFTQQCLVL